LGPSLKYGAAFYFLGLMFHGRKLVAVLACFYFGVCRSIDLLICMRLRARRLFFSLLCAACAAGAFPAYFYFWGLTPN
jgi:hypothetical protein